MIPPYQQAEAAQVETQELVLSYFAALSEVTLPEGAAERIFS